ncbi:transmembrane protein 245-like isoform X2 [Ptychodera flava]|uniref:transmembrane protein 245-like isoform X2 n=1 Tax=Ptychodera flava TaxID=63121 RepID=UPI003969BBEC
METEQEEREDEEQLEIEKEEVTQETQIDSAREKETPKSGWRRLSLRNRKKKKARKLSDRYFIALIWACVVVRLWMHLWILQLLPIPIIIWLLKKTAKRFNLWECLKSKAKFRLTCAGEAVRCRERVLVPKPIRGLGKLILRGDAKFISLIEDSLDKIISIFIILLLLVTTVFVSFLLAMQVQGESMQLVMVTSNLLNSTISNQPDMNKWLSDTVDVRKVLDSMLNNAYLYGREWIASKLNSALSGTQVNKSEIEKEILTVWDRLYEEWIKKNSSTVQSSVTRGSVFSPWSTLYSSFSKIEGLELQISNLIAVIKDNIGTLLSVLESVWIVLKGNINLAFTVVTTTLSLVLGGGTALLNFFVSMVVFITTLFYLLSFSDEQYKPAVWFASLTPGNISGPNKLGQAVEEAIRSVFGASVKMATFYGLYTWLTHTIFDIKIVFIPSALAAFLGAVPFLGTYWAALPGVIDLLVQGENVEAVLLIVVHFLPTYFVDTAIYADITGGGHPYLTGLAVVGGIYCVGFEGALIGPILLCCLMVAFNVYGSVMEAPATTPDSDEIPGKTTGKLGFLRRGYSVT